MRYYELIEWINGAPSRSEAIDKNQTINILRKQCSSALNASPIYRGIKSTNQFMFVNPQQFTRKSKNTSNHHTLLVDNMASWSDYPKRSESIICSTDKRKASGYGQLYRVLPINGSKIGICSQDDWWFSFLNFDNYQISVRDFNIDIENMFDKVLDDVPDDDDWPMLSDWIDMVDERISESPDTYELFSDYLSNNGRDTVKQSLIDLLEPTANGFELTTIENFNTNGNQEVWTDGPSLLIDESIYNDFITGISS